jgi:nitroreductase
MSRTAELVTAVEHAVRAPSVHNTQPWRFRTGEDAVQLHADWTRHLAATDPDRRDLVLSCGAALHHLLVSLAARGQQAHVERLPDPDDLGHLATVTIRSGAGVPADPALLPALTRRRTDRRRMSHRPVPPEHLRMLGEQAERSGVLLVPVTGTALRRRLGAVLVDAADRQRWTPGYPAELELWTRRYAGSRDGVPLENVAPHPVGTVDAAPLRPFPRGRLEQPPLEQEHAAASDASELLVVCTPADTVADRLRAGEATSAILLTATTLGLATTPLSQAVEVDAVRQAVRHDVLHLPEHPQLVLRVGWPATRAATIPPTPRRDLRSVLIDR